MSVVAMEVEVGGCDVRVGFLFQLQDERFSLAWCEDCRVEYADIEVTLLPSNSQRLPPRQLSSQERTYRIVHLKIKYLNPILPVIPDIHTRPLTRQHAIQHITNHRRLPQSLHFPPTRSHLNLKIHRRIQSTHSPHIKHNPHIKHMLPGLQMEHMSRLPEPVEVSAEQARAVHSILQDLRREEDGARVIGDVERAPYPALPLQGGPAVDLLEEGPIDGGEVDVQGDAGLA